MAKYQYINILANNTLTSIKMMLNYFVFQQGNDSKHASKYAKDYFSEKTPEYWNDHLNRLI